MIFFIIIFEADEHCKPKKKDKKKRDKPESALLLCFLFGKLHPPYTTKFGISFLAFLSFSGKLCYGLSILT